MAAKCRPETRAVSELEESLKGIPRGGEM